MSSTVVGGAGTATSVSTAEAVLDDFLNRDQNFVFSFDLDLSFSLTSFAGLVGVAPDTATSEDGDVKEVLETLTGGGNCFFFYWPIKVTIIVISYYTFLFAFFLLCIMLKTSSSASNFYYNKTDVTSTKCNY